MRLFEMIFPSHFPRPSCRSAVLLLVMGLLAAAVSNAADKEQEKEKHDKENGKHHAEYFFLPFDVPRATGTRVNTNSTDAIAGELYASDGDHGFIYDRHGFRQFDVPFPGAVGTYI